MLQRCCCCCHRCRVCFGHVSCRCCLLNCPASLPVMCSEAMGNNILLKREDLQVWTDA